MELIKALEYAGAHESYTKAEHDYWTERLETMMNQGLLGRVGRYGLFGREGTVTIKNAVVASQLHEPTEPELGPWLDENGKEF